MRATLVLALLLALPALAGAVHAAGVCDAPGSACAGGQRCTAASAACERDTGASCAGAADSGTHTLTSAANALTLQSACASGGQSRSVFVAPLNVFVARWSSESSGSAHSGSLQVVGGFAWSGNGDANGCTIVIPTRPVIVCGSTVPPGPPVPAGVLLP